MSVYRRRPSRDIVWTHYQDSNNWVVFNPASADVHLVTASAHHLWTLVPEDRGRSTAELIAALAADSGCDIDRAFAQTTEDTLAFLDSAGLLESVSP